MAQYISKSAVVAEIERIKKEECPTDSYEGRCKLLWFEQFLSFLDTFETKDVDLEEEITNIEYIRKDAFIEKATEWLCYNYDKYIRIIGSSVYPAYTELCKDFQKAMEE